MCADGVREPAGCEVVAHVDPSDRQALMEDKTRQPTRLDRRPRRLDMDRKDSRQDGDGGEGGQKRGPAEQPTPGQQESGSKGCDHTGLAYGAAGAAGQRSRPGG